MFPTTWKTKEADLEQDMESSQTDEISSIITTSDTNLYITEVLLKADHRCSSPKIQEAIKHGFEGVLERKSFAFLERKQILPNSNILQEKIIMAVHIVHILTAWLKYRTLRLGSVVSMEMVCFLNNWSNTDPKRKKGANFIFFSVCKKIFHLFIEQVQIDISWIDEPFISLKCYISYCNRYKLNNCAIIHYYGGDNLVLVVWRWWCCIAKSIFPLSYAKLHHRPLEQ